MFILFVAPRYHTNQIPIVEGLLRSGYQVRFLVMHKGISEDYKALEPDILPPSLAVRIKYHNIHRKKGEVYAENWILRHYKPEYFSVLRYLISMKPDVVILRERSRQSRIVYTCCKILKIRKVILYNQKHLYSDWNGNYIKKLVAKIVFPRVRYTPVKYLKLLSDIEDQVSLVVKPHEYFVPFVQSIDNFDDKEYMKNGIINILDVGKYRDYKNHNILVEAVSLMHRHKNIHISIVGQVSNDDEQEYFNDLVSLIKDKNLSDIISLHKNIPFDEMKNLYAINDIFVLPSKNELASISVLEAMANGLCTISTDNNGTAFYVLEGNAGMVFDYTSAQDLAKKLSYLVEHPEKIRCYGQNAIQYIRENCRFEDYLNGLRNILLKEFNYSI